MPDRREGGFALPVTIFIVALVTIMLAAILVRVDVDRYLAESSGTSIDALAIAHSGLQRYYAHYDTLGNRPPDGDSLRFNMSGGYADVVARVMRQPADSALPLTYVVRSTGRVIQPTRGADPQAVRTVAQFAHWVAPDMDPIGAFTAANRFDHPPSGSPGDIWMIGNDRCGMEPNIPGLRVPEPPPSPLPPNIQPFLEADGTPPEVALLTGIDWPAIVGGEFTPDYTSMVNLDTWSSYLVTGDAILNTPSGSGLLIVTGDLQLGGAGAEWHGVILVGGEIRFEGTWNRFFGVVVSGLNYQLGQTPPNGYWGSETTNTRIHFDSCDMRRALTAAAALEPVANAWVDNWATY